MNEHGDTCNRHVELWNLVFMQFDRQPDGSLPPLPAPSVDTGMGMERAAVILQDVDTIYKTDLFRPLIARVEALSGKRYGGDHDTDYAMHAVAEHGRSATFLIADGVVLGNEGRGYVLRRVVRRAIRQARRIGIDGPFLEDISDAAVAVMGDAYPEQVRHREFIHTVLRLEEERFQQAYANGYAVLSEALKGSESLPGDVVFRLWDTYGFPVEMTQEIGREAGVEVDLEGFEREMTSQRERARASGQFGGDRAKIRVYESLGVGATKFLGYDQLNASSIVVGLVSGGEAVNEASEGDDVEVVLLETPFYAEGGGQIGDAGRARRAPRTDRGQGHADGNAGRDLPLRRGSPGGLSLSATPWTCRSIRFAGRTRRATTQPPTCCTRRSDRCSGPTSGRQDRSWRLTGSGSTSATSSR